MDSRKDNLINSQNCNKNSRIEVLVIFLFIDALVGLFIALRYEIALPYSYVSIFILIYLLLFASFKYNVTRIYPMLVIFYTISIVSVFAIRFGLFHGDSQIDLTSVQYILRYGFIKNVQSYSFELFPVIHILTVSLGLIIGENNATSIYNVAIWMPTIISIILALFTFLIINKITGKSKPALLGAIILVSLPFISRWLMQFTRTTAALAFLIILGYLLIKTDRDKITSSLNILIIILILTVILAHPVVSFFGVLSLIFIFIYEIIRTSLGSKLDKIVESTPSVKRFDVLVVLSITLLVIYWIYNAYMLNPFIKTMQSFFISFETFFKGSITSEILNNRAQSSFSVASIEFKIFGLLRVIFFIIISLIGLRFISFDKKFKSIVTPLSVFAIIFWAINYGTSVSSTTFYRTAVYSSLWLIMVAGYFIYRINESRLSKFRKTLIFTLLTTLLIIPAPFFSGEVVLPSDWLYSPHPIEQIDYEHGEAQRFLEHYHIDVALWINKYTDNTSLIWSDGAYSYAAISGYGERNATYSNVALTKDGIIIHGLKTLKVNYVALNDLMRRALMIPYGIPPFYPHYNYNELETNFSSYKIYDSGDANVYKIS